MNDHTMSHEDVQDDIPAFLLGGLEPEEEAAMRSHLRGCPECTLVLASFAPARDALASGTPPVAVPDGIIDRLLARVRVEPPPSAIRALPAPDARRRSPARLPWALLAASVIVALALGAMALRLSGAASEYRAQAAEKQATIDAVVDLMERADLEVKDLEPGAGGARTRVYEAREGDVAMVVLDRLPPLGEGQVYQLWVGQPDALESAGTFTPTARGSYHKLLEPPGGFARYGIVAVSPAPEGGRRIAPPANEMTVRGEI